MNHLISIIIPYFNHWDLTHGRLAEIYKYLPENCEIILVNDASTELDCKTGVAWWQKNTQKHKIKYVENPVNLGFGGSHNRGAKAAEGDILVFLSNDVIIGGNFIQSVMENIDKYNGEVLMGGRVLYNDTGWNVLIINGKPSIIAYPEGWLVSCTKTMWDRIGGWSKDYGKFDYEDVELGAWALYNDVKLVGLNLPFLRHLFGQTIKDEYPNRQEYSEHNREVFRNKWTEKLEEKFK